MPPMRTSSFFDPSCVIAFVYRLVTCPSRDRVKFRAVNQSAPAANRPAPSVSNRPRALSSAVSCSDPVAEPTSWCASQSAAGTNSTHATAAASTTTAMPPTSLRIPCGKAAQCFLSHPAQRFNIGKR